MEYLSGDGIDAYTLLSKACQAKIDRNEFFGNTLAAKQIYGNLPVKTFRVNSITTVDARVTYTFAVPALTQTQERWVLEGGNWREDDC